MRHLPVQAAAQFDLEPVTTARPPATSALQKRGEYLLQFLERHRAFEFLAIDEEGRCRVDLQLIGGKLLIGLDLLQKGFIPLAGFDGVSVHPEMAGNRFQGVERSFHEFALKSMVVASKYFATSPLAMQRASMVALAAAISSGKARDTKRTLPVSIYFDCGMGKMFSEKAAQCGQVIEEYSTMVIGALAEPNAMSGSTPGFQARRWRAGRSEQERDRADESGDKRGNKRARRHRQRASLRFRPPTRRCQRRGAATWKRRD